MLHDMQYKVETTMIFKNCCNFPERSNKPPWQEETVKPVPPSLLSRSRFSAPAPVENTRPAAPARGRFTPPVRLTTRRKTLFSNATRASPIGLPPRLSFKAETTTTTEAAPPPSTTTTTTGRPLLRKVKVGRFASRQRVPQPTEPTIFHQVNRG